MGKVGAGNVLAPKISYRFNSLYFYLRGNSVVNTHNGIFLILINVNVNQKTRTYHNIPPSINW